MRILKYALKNIIRNPFLSISSVFVIGLLILFVNILLVVLFASERFIESVNDRISFTINFQSGYTMEDPRARNLEDRLRTDISDIKISYISKDDALDLLRVRNPDLVSLIENTGENPLPESIRVDNIPRHQYELFNTLIGESRDIIHYDKDVMDQKLVDYTSQFDRVNQIVKLLKILEVGVFALLILFLFTVVVILYSVISNSISFQEDEIEIIELVGGKPSFIYGPFLFQSIIYAGGATCIILGLLFFVQSSWMVGKIPSTPIRELIEAMKPFFPHVAGVELIVFVSLGILAALIALQSRSIVTLFGFFSRRKRRPQ